MAEPIIKACKTCGNSFESSQSNRKRKLSAQFCSVKCRGIASRSTGKKCSVSKCDNAHQARGLCNKHYMRRLRNADPLISQTNRGDGPNAEARFWSRVDRSHGPNSCWIWKGVCSPYGFATINGRRRGAHRVAWFYTKGSMPIQDLLHSCDTPPCVNPAHLREGTSIENIKDKIARNRQARGEKIAVAKLTWEKVNEIRVNVTATEKELMAKYGLSRSAISNVRRNISWRIS